MACLNAHQSNDFRQAYVTLKEAHRLRQDWQTEVTNLRKSERAYLDAKSHHGEMHQNFARQELKAAAATRAWEDFEKSGRLSVSFSKAFQLLKMILNTYEQETFPKDSLFLVHIAEECTETNKSKQERLAGLARAMRDISCLEILESCDKCV